MFYFSTDDVLVFKKKKKKTRVEQIQKVLKFNKTGWWI